MATRKASFQASYTTSVQVSGSTKDYEDTYNVLVSNSTVTVGVFDWDFADIDDDYDTLVTEVASSTIEDVQLAFQYNNNQDMINLKVLDYDGGDPSVATGAQILAAIQSTELGEVDVTSTTQTGVIVDLDDIGNLYYGIMLAIAARENVTFGLWRDTDITGSTGSVEVSGTSLIGGVSEWRAASASEPIAPPLLILTYRVDAESHPTLNLKYTTSDPTIVQSSPENSIGGHLSLNDIYESAAIKEPISSTQVSVPIAASASLPSKVGLASVGPEVFKYNTIDATNHQLTNVERAIAPLSSFPAGFDSFRIPENVYYLSTSDDSLHLLFNTRPATSLVQYRCVAIANTDTDDNFNIQDAFIGVIQSSEAKSQVRIGVEVPRWDTLSGVAVDGRQNTGDELLVTSDQAADGFYDGAFLKLIDLSGSVNYAIVDSYVFDVSSSTGEFILDRAVTGLVAGWSYIIMPAPSQTISNDATAPSSNSGRFSGFSETVEGIEVELIDHGTTMQENDVFYVWIKRTLTANTEAEDDTGAVLIFRYRDV